MRESIFESWERYRNAYMTQESMLEYLKEKGFTHIIYNRIDNTPVPEYVLLMTKGKEPLFRYGPVENLELGRSEEFFLFVL